VAVVLGAFSPDERADDAADLLARGFGVDASDKPTIWTFEAGGEVPEAAPNMRSIVCTEEAHKRRMERRGDATGPVYLSPHIAELTRDREAVEISLGGTEGPVMRRFANVPVPKFRPAPSAVAKPVPVGGELPSSASAFTPVAAPGIPIPMPRPDRQAAGQGG
jgi:D-alanyl-D-alanine carboxypeptidase